MKTFAIGDIHGCYTYLSALTTSILEREYTPGDKFVFIGDYIDRGPDSKSVIDFLISFSQAYDCVFLRGNHEDMFLAYMNTGEGHYGDMFFYNGGGATIESYKPDTSKADFHGIAPIDKRANTQYDTARDQIPKAHIEFIKNTKMYYDTDKILFVHAGVDPHATLEQNTWSNFLWVDDNRDRFFHMIKQKPWHKLMIHGHTICATDSVKSTIELENRINIDTGAFKTDGRLTCLVVDDTLEAKDWKYYQVGKYCYPVKECL